MMPSTHVDMSQLESYSEFREQKLWVKLIPFLQIRLHMRHQVETLNN